MAFVAPGHFGLLPRQAFDELRTCQQAIEQPRRTATGQRDAKAATRPDGRAYTLWDTIQNTIEDPDLTLYLVLDEAHRGMGNLSTAAQSDKSTIVRRLINGAGHRLRHDPRAIAVLLGWLDRQRTLDA